MELRKSGETNVTPRIIEGPAPVEPPPPGAATTPNPTIPMRDGADMFEDMAYEAECNDAILEGRPPPKRKTIAKRNSPPQQSAPAVQPGQQVQPLAPATAPVQPPPPEPRRFLVAWLGSDNGRAVIMSEVVDDGRLSWLLEELAADTAGPEPIIVDVDAKAKQLKYTTRRALVVDFEEEIDEES
jgi:hypothetical protein